VGVALTEGLGVATLEVNCVFPYKPEDQVPAQIEIVLVREGDVFAPVFYVFREVVVNRTIGSTAVDLTGRTRYEGVGFELRRRRHPIEGVLQVIVADVRGHEWL
jgi:hypothetical protein